MKIFALLASVAGLARASIDVDDATVPQKIRFESWLKKHNKVFEDIAEMKKAWFGWIANDKIIQETNAQDLPYKLGHNPYSHMTSEEFASKYTMTMPKSHMRKNNDNVAWELTDPVLQADAPDSIDWVEKGAVTPVKNQKQCGSCWAFSTTGSVEGAFQIAGNKLTSLSEQELVSCDHVDDGCKGGLMDNGFKFVEENGLCTESSYPYVSGSGNRGTCKKTCKAAVTVHAFKDVPKKDEDALKLAVSKQPVSIAIEADKSVFQLYKKGVMNSKSCGTNLDHGVLAVGYGTEGGEDYWKVKNSWGPDWGMEGYILLGRGDNICGISQQPSYPEGATAAGPSPGPGPAPAPSPGPTPPSGKTHYEDPNDGGCQSDEVDISITGITGSICSPKCTGIFKTKCPTDVPAGVTAEPECALQDSTSHEKYCALICSPSTDEASLRAGDAQCSSKASCKAVPNADVGLCTYDS